MAAVGFGRQIVDLVLSRDRVSVGQQDTIQAHGSGRIRTADLEQRRRRPPLNPPRGTRLSRTCLDPTIHSALGESYTAPIEKAKPYQRSKLTSER
jgi:hypothetical protein